MLGNEQVMAISYIFAFLHLEIMNIKIKEVYECIKTHYIIAGMGI
jgi:hypothetical protein